MASEAPETRGLAAEITKLHQNKDCLNSTARREKKQVEQEAKKDGIWGLFIEAYTGTHMDS